MHLGIWTHMISVLENHTKALFVNSFFCYRLFVCPQSSQWLAQLQRNTSSSFASLSTQTQQSKKQHYCDQEAGKWVGWHKKSKRNVGMSFSRVEFTHSSFDKKKYVEDDIDGWRRRQKEESVKRRFLIIFAEWHTSSAKKINWLQHIDRVCRVCIIISVFAHSVPLRKFIHVVGERLFTSAISAGTQSEIFR